MKKAAHSILFMYSLLFFAVSFRAQIPTLSWAKKMDCKNGFMIKDAIVDSSGNFYVTGNYLDSADFDPDLPVLKKYSYNNDGFLVKFNSAGNLVWQKQWSVDFSRTIWTENLSFDFAGNIYLKGNYTYSLDADPGSGSHIIFSSPGSQARFLIKLSAEGDFKWCRNFIGDMHIGDLRCDLQQNLYIVGKFSNTIDFDHGPASHTLSASNTNGDGFILKIDSVGNFKWVRSLQGAWCQNLATENDRNIYIAGNAAQGADLDPGVAAVLTPSAGAFICLIDSTGNYQKSCLFPGDGSIHSIIFNKEIIIAGTFGNSFDLDPGPGTNMVTQNGAIEGFLVRLDTSLYAVWMNQIKLSSQPDPNGNYISKLKLQKKNETQFYLFSLFNGSFDFDPSNSISILNDHSNNNTSAMQPDIGVAVYDPACNLQWAACFGSLFGGYGLPVAAKADAIYSSGAFKGTVDFDPFSTSFSLTPKASYAMFIHKLADCPAPPQLQLTASQQTVCETQDVLLNASGASSYYWEYGLPMTASLNYPMTAKKTFYLTGINADGCSSTTSITIDVANCTGLSDHSAERVQAFPNPVSDTIHLVDVPAGSEIMIYDKTGRLVKDVVTQTSDPAVDIRHLEKGIYIVKIENGSRMISTFKIVKD